jgi:hypothetical protein
MKKVDMAATKSTVRAGNDRTHSIESMSDQNSRERMMKNMPDDSPKIKIKTKTRPIKTETIDLELKNGLNVAQKPQVEQAQNSKKAKKGQLVRPKHSLKKQKEIL